jgi:DNA helicase-2/ATP-dependent DNA helicase PcrA
MFVVGDDDQSIYGWRGADVAFIRRFRRDFPDAVDIRLEENFRSTGHILAAANAIIAEDKARLGKTLFTRKGQGTPVELMSFRDGDAEAAGLPDALIARKGEGARWAEMAVLYRNNFLSRAFEEALMRARIPYRLVGDVGFYARAEIKDALALLRLAAMPDDRQSNEAFRRVINELRRGFGAKAIEILERDASFFDVSLLAVETAALPSEDQGSGRSVRQTYSRRGRQHDADARRPTLPVARSDRLPCHATREPGGEYGAEARKSRGTARHRRRLPQRARIPGSCDAGDEPRKGRG